MGVSSLSLSGRRRLSKQARENIKGYLFISPWLLGFLLWVLGPMVASMVISFTEWDILTPPEFVGFKNYTKLLDPNVYFLKALYNTIYITAIGVPLQVVLALFVAQFLNYRGRGINLFRTIFYLPMVTPIVASALVWLMIFNPEFGLANTLLRLFKLPEQRWFLDPGLSKPLIIVWMLWHIGGSMVIFLGGLQSVPESLYDAAEVDGAGPVRQFFSITLPLISPVIFFVITTSIIGTFQVFTVAFITTGGGPIRSTLFYVLYLYKNAFEYLRMGFGSGLAWVLFVIILVVTLVQFKLANRWVYYEVS